MNKRFLNIQKKCVFFEVKSFTSFFLIFLSEGMATKKNPVNDKKVKSFEAFLNEKLRPDLKSVLEDRDKIYEEIAEYLSLKNSIEALETTGFPKPLKTRVDLGCNFYMRANVAEPEKIFVDVGLGFFLELGPKDAIEFIDKKTKFLQTKADNLTEESTKIKANIKIVIHGLREIQVCHYAPETFKM